MANQSFICNVCQNYGTAQCADCNGKGLNWAPTNGSFYEKDPQAYMSNLILACKGGKDD